MKQTLALFTIIILLFSCKKPAESVQPTLGAITESVYASGVVKSKNQYQVFPTVNGLVQKILVAEGDIVKKGDPLLVISNETAQLNRENAKLAADFADINTQNNRINEAKIAIETAKSKMLNDSMLWSRQQGLWAQQIGSKVELEQRELAYISAKNAYQSAIYRYNDLQKQLKFAAQQSQKLLAISQNVAGDYIVRSQTAGRVYSISKEVGEIVGPQSPVAIIGDAEGFLLELQVDEYDIAKIKKGQKISVGLDSYKGQAFEALVAKISPLMNERTRTFTVEATFTQQPPILYPNLTVEANIILETRENVLTIPRTYLIADSLVLLENKEQRKVETGLKDYQKVEIRAGLTVNDKILYPAK